MKAICVRQPYASLIAEGIIDYSPSYFRVSVFDTLFLYAPLNFDSEFAKCPMHFIEKLNTIYGLELDTYSDLGAILSFPTGGIVGVADLMSCEPVKDSFSSFETYACVFRNQVLYPFKACRGFHGVFDVAFSLNTDHENCDTPLFGKEKCNILQRL